jgi:hypothetical protein
MDLKSWKNFIRQKERSIGGGYRAIGDRREYNEYVRSLRGGKTWSNEGGNIWQAQESLRVGRQLHGGAEYQLGTYYNGTVTLSRKVTLNSLKDMNENEVYLGADGVWYNSGDNEVQVKQVNDAKPAAPVAAPGAPFKDHLPFVAYISNDGNYYMITNIKDGGKSAEGVKLSEAPTMDAKSANFVKGVAFIGDNEGNLPDPAKQDVGFRLDYMNPNFTIGGGVLKDMEGYENREAALIATINSSGGIAGNSGEMTTGSGTPVWLAWPEGRTVRSEKPAANIDVIRKRMQPKSSATKPAAPSASKKAAELAKLKAKMGQTPASPASKKKPAASSKTKAAELAKIQARMGQTTASANNKKSAGSPAIAKAKKAQARVLSPGEEELATLRSRMGKSSTKQPESLLEKIRRRQLGFTKIDTPKQVLLSKLQQILRDRAKQEEEPHPFIIVLDAKEASSINLQKVKLTREVDYEFKRGVKKSGYKAYGKRGKYMSFATVCRDAREEDKESFMVKSASGEIRHYIVVGNKCVRQLHDGIHLMKFSSKYNYMGVVSRITEFNKAVDADHQITEFQRVNKQGENVHYVLKNGRFVKK